MRGVDPRAKAMEELFTAIQGYRRVVEMNPVPRNDVGLAEQAGELEGQLRLQIQTLTREFPENIDPSHHVGESLRQLGEIELGIQALLPQNQEGQVLIAPGPDRVPLGGVNQENQENSQNQINEQALRDLLNQFLRNIDGAREGPLDGVRGAGGGAGGAGAGAGGAGAGGAGAGAGIGDDGGVDGGGVGGGGDPDNIQNLMNRVAQLLRDRAIEFQQMQEDRARSQNQAQELVTEVGAIAGELAQVVQTQAALAQAAEERAARSAAAEQAAEELAEAARAELVAAEERARAAEERAAAAQAEAEAAARAAEAEAERARVAEAAAQAERVAAEREKAAAEARAAHEEQTAKDALQFAEEATRITELTQLEFEKFKNELRELIGDYRPDKKRKKGLDRTLLPIEEDNLIPFLKEKFDFLNKWIDDLRKDSSKFQDLEKELEKALEGNDKKDQIISRFKSLFEFRKKVENGPIFPGDKPDPAVPPRPGPGPGPVPSPAGPPDPAPGPAGPPGSDQDTAQVRVAKETVEILEDEKKRNGLYLRINYNEAKITANETRDSDSNLFSVITDEVGSDRKIAENSSYQFYQVSNRDYFIRALNNEIDFTSENGVRICFMKSKSTIKIGDCDITKQSFIDVNDEIAKTRIFIDDNGRKKIEDYRIRLEKEFKKFLEDHRDKKCDPDHKKGNLSKIHSLKGLDDLNKLKTQMSTWGTGSSPNVNVFDDDFSDDKIAKKAKELADKCLANRFKSGIIGVEKEKAPALVAGAGVAGAPATAKEYEEDAFGFIKIVRSKKSNEPVRVFVGETAGPTTANIWDEKTKSYIQVELATTKIGEGANEKTVIEGIKKVEQYTQNGHKIDPPTSLLKIDFFIEKTGDRSGLFALDAPPAPAQAPGSNLQMLHKTEIRNVAQSDQGYYLTNGFAHQNQGGQLLHFRKSPIGKIQATDLNNNNQTRDINAFISTKDDILFEIETERQDNFKKTDEPLISEFMGKAIPKYIPQKEVKGIVLRSGGKIAEANITMEKEISSELLKVLCVFAKDSDNTSASTRIGLKQISRTASPPASSPKDPSANAAQAQKPSCFGILSGG